MTTPFLSPNPHPGKLIVVEGIDGSGKSTQLHLLRRYLEGRGYSVFFTEWNSSSLVKETTKMGKKKKFLTPTTFSLLHATDFTDRFHYQILPPLKSGMIVLADRYVFTALTRDVARGVHPDWVKKLYSFALRPDLSFYFKVPIDVSIDRLLRNRAKIKYYEAGMDVGLSNDIVESFRLFQSRVLHEYDRMTSEQSLSVIDATLDIEEQQEIMREQVDKVLSGYKQKRRNYGKK